MSSAAVYGKRRPVEVPSVEWDAFREQFTEAHKQGEHVAIVAPTQSGKSTLAFALLDYRAKHVEGTQVVAFCTKPRDDTLTRTGWKRIKSWPPPYGEKAVLFWPTYPRNPEQATVKQRAAIRPVLLAIFNDGKYHVYFDEAWIIETKLRLDKITDEYWSQGASLKITIWAGTQRPVGVSRHVWAEPSWVFLFRTRDKDELKRVSEIGGGTDTALVRHVIQDLEDHEFLCIRTRTGEMVRSKVVA